MWVQIFNLCAVEHVKCGTDQNTIDDIHLNCVQKSDLRSLLFRDIMQH
jgi:hypothetical protein